MIEATSCGGVVIFRGKILLLYKNYRNKYEGWVLPKGTVEENEEHNETALREVKEETGLTLTEYRYRGLVTFVSNQWGTEYMHLFTATAYEGEMKECDEGNLEWVSKDKIEELNLWEGDKIFFRLLNQNAPFFSLKLCYDEDRLVSYQVREYV